MRKSTLLKAGTAASVIIWVIAITLFAVVSTLPDFASRPAVGCYTTNAMISYVECHNTADDDLFGQGMTLAMYWVAGAFIWLALGTMAVGTGHWAGFFYLGLFAVWFLTVLLILIPLFRFLRTQLFGRNQ